MNASVFYEKYLNASAQELAQNGAFLQDLARRYPWFSLGRLLLFKSLCGLGGEASLSESEKTALYVYSRSMPYFILQESLQAEEKQAENEFFTLDLSQEIEKEEAAPSPSAGKQDRLELDVTVPIDRFISDKPRFVQMLARTGENIDTQQQDTPPVLSDNEFVTETLARIYAQQGYHKLAIASYGKLILLYPEKSAYFATLVQEIKQKINN